MLLDVSRQSRLVVALNLVKLLLEVLILGKLCKIL